MSTVTAASIAPVSLELVARLATTASYVVGDDGRRRPVIDAPAARRRPMTTGTAR
jgi:hypothetical protein